jgi:hypothetical protein
MRSIPLLAEALCFSILAPALADTASAPNVEVTYTGISPAQAAAVADTLSAARALYVDDFALDMPEAIKATVTCADDQKTRLFTDGQSHVTLTLSSAAQLDRPSKSGVFNLYGMCHELGHVAMYRTLKDRDWMTGPAAEGFAHWAGAYVVDRVYESNGEKLWQHDPYDYRVDGLARLKKQLAAGKPDETTRAASLWQELDGIIGHKQFPKVFASWQAAKVDPADPARALIDALVQSNPRKKQALENWWKLAGPVMTTKIEASGFKAATLTKDKLTGRPALIAEDDNTPDGKKSIAGGGHARQFAPPGAGDWFLTAVLVHGSRYGPAKAPDTTFDVTLCDADLKPIAKWTHPYSAFARGDAAWVRLAIPPTRAPKDFQVCLTFRPTASSGVFVSLDSSTSGHSQSGTPGKPGPALKEGDWMIRVELDQAKGADALKGEK